MLFYFPGDKDDYEHEKIDRDKQEQLEEDSFNENGKNNKIIDLSFATAPLMKVWSLLHINDILTAIEKNLSKPILINHRINLNKLIVYLVFRLIINYYKSLRYWSFPNASIHRSIFDFRGIEDSSIKEALLEIAGSKDYLIEEINKETKGFFNENPQEGIAFVVKETFYDFDVFASGVLCLLTDLNGIPLDFQFIFKARPSTTDINDVLKSLQKRHKLTNVAVVAETGLDKLFKEKGIKPKNLSFTVFRSKFLSKNTEYLVSKDISIEEKNEVPVPSSKKAKVETLIQKPGAEIWIHSNPSGQRKKYYNQIEEILNPLKKLSISFSDIYERVWNVKGETNSELMTIGQVIVQFLSLVIIGTIKKLIQAQNINLNSRELIELFHTMEAFAWKTDNQSQIEFIQKKIKPKIVKNQIVDRYPKDQWELFFEIMKILGVTIHHGETMAEMFEALGGSYPLSPRLDKSKEENVEDILAKQSKTRKYRKKS